MSNYSAKVKSVLFLPLLFILVISQGCGMIKNTAASDPKILIANGFDKTSPLAVLTFSRHGSSLAADVGRTIADRLSEKMFMTDSFHIAERSRVNEALRFFEIRSLDELSLDEIQKLGMRLKVNFLILGSIQSVSKSSYINDSSFNLDEVSDSKDRKIFVSFRIISVLTSDILGQVSFTIDPSEGNAQEKIDEMLDKAVYRLSVLR